MTKVELVSEALRLNVFPGLSRSAVQVYSKAELEQLIRKAVTR
jgi:hypothetical protein